MKNTQKIIFSLATFSMLFSGCFPKRIPSEFYELPVDSLEFTTENAQQEEPFVPGEWPNVRWWLMFNDCQLNDLMDQALSENPDVKIAQARVRLAYHTAGSVGSPLWPSIGLESDITRFRISKTGAISGFTNLAGEPNLVTTPGAAPLPAPIGPPGFTFTQEEININGNYQIDIWQKNLNNFKAAIGEVLATEADSAFATIMISINLAKAYFNLQVMYDREQNAIKRIDNRKEYLKLVKKRLNSDLDTMLTVKTAESYVIAAEEALKEIQLAIELYKHQIQALIAGSFDEQLDHISIESKELVQFPLPTDLPLDLLSHRPDVTATAWRVEEMAKLIKVARAAYYPNFNIVALFGFQTIHPKEMFNWNSIYGQAGPAVNLPIFEGGLLYANLGQANDNYNIAVEQYNKTIISSIQNVLDSLAGLKYVYGELNDYSEIVDLSEQNLGLTQRRYKNHIDSYINVLDAQLDMITKEDQKLVTLAYYYQQFTNLISALGGGYHG